MKKLYDAAFLKSWPTSKLSQLKMIEKKSGGKYGWPHA